MTDYQPELIDEEFEAICDEHDTEAFIHHLKNGEYEIEWTGAPGATEFFYSTWAFSQRLNERANA